MLFNWMKISIECTTMYDFFSAFCQKNHEGKIAVNSRATVQASANDVFDVLIMRFYLFSDIHTEYFDWGWN